MVQSLDRAFDVLEALAEAEDDISLSQLTERVGLPLGTVHRLLGSLVARGYAAQIVIHASTVPGHACCR